MRQPVKIFLVIIFSLAGSEVLFLLLHFQPYNGNTANSKIVSDPEPLFASDSVLGYVYARGDYDVTLNGKLKYRLTVSVDGSRWNAAQPETARAQVNLYGCSFFAGMGVDDTAVVSARLQQILGDSVLVKNFSVPGYGLTSQYLLFREQVAAGQAPAVAVFSTASFHLLRNAGAFRYLQSFGSIKRAPLRYPVAKLQRDNSLYFGLKSVIPPLPGLASHSRLYMQLLLAADRIRYPDAYLLRLHNAIADSICTLASAHDVHAVFVILSKDALTDSMEQHYSKQRCDWFRSSVDYQNPDFNLMPLDGHPNDKAHLLYAKEIADSLSARKLLN